VDDRIAFFCGRYLRAFHADNGQALWQTRLASQVLGYTTVTFSITGRQYVAIADGGSFDVGP